MVRAYRIADLPAIMDIANRAWRGIYRMFRECYGEELFRIVCADETTVKGHQIQAHCEKHPEWIYVAEEEGRIVGFVTFFIDKDKAIGEIGNNAVDPDCGIKGVGQRMYQAVLEHFRAKKMRYACVRTGLDEAHARARKAYERAGFDIRHETVTYFQKLQEAP